MVSSGRFLGNEETESGELNQKNDYEVKTQTPGEEEGDLSKLLKKLNCVIYHYEYLDHPADVILLGEGRTIKEALQSVSIALFNYMSDLSYVDATHHKKVEVTGRGLVNFLYHYLDECLYLYSSEYFIAKHVLIEEEVDLPITDSLEEFDEYQFKINAIAVGDYYDRSKHKCGTEVKAITMHYLNFNMLVGDRWYEYKNDNESENQTEDLMVALKKTSNKIERCKVYALVDI